MMRDGAGVMVRLASVADAVALQSCFRDLSVSSRYNRLMGAAGELPAEQLQKIIHSGRGGTSVLAVTQVDGCEQIVGEARYAFDQDGWRVELGLSIDDRPQRWGLGAALLSNLEGRAAALGAAQLFGDTLRSNHAMLAVARRAGFALAATPGDWKQVRFEKRIDAMPQALPGASLRMAGRGEVAMAH
jgi:RimJ/RimL family protein N-acetyltransferase